MNTASKETGLRRGERGFSLIQLVVALGIVAILTSIAIFGIRSARAAMRLNNSARSFAQLVERARLDAIRRRATTHVEFTDSTTYEIQMDFANTGSNQTRAFTLDSGVVVTDASGNALTSTSDELPYADFDWRGRTYECNMLFRLKNDRSDTTVVQVAGSGDISVNNAVTTMPTVSYNTSISTTSDVNPSATLTGTDTKLNLSPCGTSTSGGGGSTGGGSTGGGGGSTTCAAGTLSTNTTYISDLRRNGLGTRTVTVTITAPGTVTTTYDTNNLSVTTSSSTTITSSSGGSITFTVRSVSKSIATFPVRFFFSNCTPVTVNVKVTK